MEFSSTFITPLQAHKLIAFESDEARRSTTGSPELLRHESGMICGQLLQFIPSEFKTKYLSMILRKEDHVNAIAVAAALASFILTITTFTPGFFSSLGFLFCAILINLVVPLHADNVGRPQRTILSRYVVALCEGAVVACCIAWARTPFLVGIILVGIWLAFHLAASIPTFPVRPTATDYVVLLAAIALAGGGENLSPATIMLAAAGASFVASIALEKILRGAGVVSAETLKENQQKFQYFGFDFSLIFSCGFSRFILVVTLIGALFGGASKFTFLSAFLSVFISEIFRTISLSNALKTPLFQNVSIAYTDGVYDMCHIGHKNLVNFASTLGHRVVVGVICDEDCINYKRPPVMTTDERVTEVKALLGVSRVIRGSPCWGLTEEFLRQENIDVVVCGEEYMQKPVEEDRFYGVARRMGIAVGAPRTTGISTSALIKRIASRDASSFAAKDKMSGSSTVKE